MLSIIFLVNFPITNASVIIYSSYTGALTKCSSYPEDLAEFTSQGVFTHWMYWQLTAAFYWFTEKVNKRQHPFRQTIPTYKWINIGKKLSLLTVHFFCSSASPVAQIRDTGNLSGLEYTSLHALQKLHACIQISNHVVGHVHSWYIIK